MSDLDARLALMEKAAEKIEALNAQLQEANIKIKIREKRIRKLEAEVFALNEQLKEIIPERGQKITLLQTRDFMVKRIIKDYARMLSMRNYLSAEEDANFRWAKVTYSSISGGE